MQFVYQHPDYCERLVLISSGGLGPDVGWTLRMLSAPGAELILPVIAPRPVLTAGNKLRSWFSAAGIQSPRGAEMWSAYSSLADSETRQAFLRTLRSVVDYRGQAVSALNRLHLTSELPTMVIWGDQDRIIPVEHGYALHEARPGSRLEVLEGVGHFPHVERPGDVVDLIDDFIDTTGHPTTRAPAHQSVAAVQQRRRPRRLTKYAMSAPCHAMATGPWISDVFMNGTAAAYATTNTTSAAAASRRSVGSSAGLMLARPRIRNSQSMTTTATNAGIQ